MKVTEKGQVTLPKKLRDKYGISSATEIEFIERDGVIILLKKGASSQVSRYRGIAAIKKGLPHRTDQFLTLLRDGDDE